MLTLNTNTVNVDGAGDALVDTLLVVEERNVGCLNARSASGLCADATFAGELAVAARSVGALVHGGSALAQTSVSQTDPEGVVRSAVNALVYITDITVVTAGQAAVGASLTSLDRGAVGRVAELAAGAASDGAVAEVHEVLGVLEVVPAGEALGPVTATSLTRVVTFELGPQNEIVELVHDESLGGVPVRLNNETISRLVVNCVLNVLKSDRDLILVES